MTKELRVLRTSEWDRWYEAFLLAFGGAGESAEEQALWAGLAEHDRFIGVWDGDECVGTAGAFSFGLTVPGGARVPAAGVTMVSVGATHRRQGVLTSMMRRQLDDVREWGEPLAVLTASEPPIYGRFGYGAATQKLSMEIDTSRVRIEAPHGADDVRLSRARLSDPEVRRVCEELYAADVAVRPGMTARAPGWERVQFFDPEDDRHGKSALQCVLAERDGESVGFVLFQTKPEFDSRGPKGTVQLHHLHARDAAAYAALWRFLFDIDLMSKVSVNNRPADDAVQHLVSDVRRSSMLLRDGLYVRPVEVGAALEARTYQAPVDVVIEVEDSFCPWNEGRWRLSGDTKGASCERTADPAELSLSAREVGAAYLGGVTLSSLARAGRVRELREGALAAASPAFASDIAPWLPHGF